MPLERNLRALPRLVEGIAIPAAWHMPLKLLAGCWLLLIAVFFADWAAMAHQWWDVATFNHILLIPAILAWLVHQRAGELARLVPSFWWPGLAVVAGAVVLWVLAAFSGLSIGRQTAAVVMLIGSALALLGPRVGAALAFPLGYMLFMVPFGEELVVPMQMLTADMTVALVHLSGIEAKIDGVFIDTPAGLFEVAEACSGVRFLVAMFAFGVLATNVCFLSWRRRALFLLLCFVVPVLANGLRAWATIYIAQFVGAEKAGGVDHLIYGWVFFGIVIAMTLAIAWRFFDRPRDGAMIDADAILASPLLGRLEEMRIGMVPALAGLAVLVLGGQAWALAGDRLEARVPMQIFLADVPGWRRVDYAPRAWWEPRATGAEHRLLGSYADGEGRHVDVFLAVYASQREGKEAGGFGEGALTPGSGWSWQAHGAGAPEGKSDRLLGAGRTARLAETYYRTGEVTTGSNSRLKLANTRDKLLLRARPTFLLILSAEERPGKPANESLEAFRRSTGPLGAWMDRMAAVR